MKLKSPKERCNATVLTRFSVSSESPGCDRPGLLHLGRAALLRAQAREPKRHGVPKAQLISRASGETLWALNSLLSRIRHRS